MIMAVNHKLTHVIKDRVVQNFQLNASELLISFFDPSSTVQKVKTLVLNDLEKAKIALALHFRAYFDHLQLA